MLEPKYVLIADDNGQSERLFSPDTVQTMILQNQNNTNIIGKTLWAPMKSLGHLNDYIVLTMSSNLGRYNHTSTELPYDLDDSEALDLNVCWTFNMDVL